MEKYINALDEYARDGGISHNTIKRYKLDIARLWRDLGEDAFDEPDRLSTFLAKFQAGLSKNTFSQSWRL